MAKIGNEARLVLKLAEKEMEKRLSFKERNADTTDRDFSNFLKGYTAGSLEYRDTLINISLELERR